MILIFFFTGLELQAKEMSVHSFGSFGLHSYYILSSCKINWISRFIYPHNICTCTVYPSNWPPCFISLYIHLFIHPSINSRNYHHLSIHCNDCSCIYMYIHVHVHTYTCTYIYIYMYIHIHIHVHTCTCTHVCTYICTFVGISMDY